MFEKIPPAYFHRHPTGDIYCWFYTLNCVFGCDRRKFRRGISYKEHAEICIAACVELSHLARSTSSRVHISSFRHERVGIDAGGYPTQQVVSLNLCVLPTQHRIFPVLAALRTLLNIVPAQLYVDYEQNLYADKSCPHVSVERESGTYPFVSEGYEPNAAIFLCSSCQLQRGYVLQIRRALAAQLVLRVLVTRFPAAPWPRSWSIDGVLQRTASSSTPCVVNTSRGMILGWTWFQLLGWLAFGSDHVTAFAKLEHNPT